VKAASKVEVDPDAAEKLIVSRADFMHALDNDVKPAFGASQVIKIKVRLGKNRECNIRLG
jgi:hypothetical protein